MKLIEADALMEAINTWPKFGVDERGRIVPWSEGYEPYIHLRDVVIAITGMPTIEPEQKVEGLLPDGTLHLFTDTDLSKVRRVLVSQNGTHYGDLYYADGEQKTGKWIYKNDLKQFFCSECGFPSLTYDDIYIYSMDLPNYCEDCGADMRCGQIEILSEKLNASNMERSSQYYNGGWIPCSETIDIPDHEVLCCDRFGEELIGWLSYNDDQWLCESDGEMMYDPVAWREKPKPYGKR